MLFEHYGSLVYIYSIGILSTLVFGTANYLLISKYNFDFFFKYSKYIFFLSLFFYIVSIFFLSFKKIEALHHYSDFATHLEVLWKNKLGNGLISLMSEDYHGGNHWFAAHFTPIMYLSYVPIFYIFPYPQTIVIVQSVIILSSLIPLFMISRNYFDNRLSYIFLTSFLFYPTIFYINLYGTAYLEAAIPLILWLIYFYKRNDNTKFFICLLLCLSVREEVSLVLCFFGLYLILNKKYYVGTSTFLISAAYFFIVMFIVIPFFKEGMHITINLFSNVGGSYKDIFKNLIFNLFGVLVEATNLAKIGNFIIYLLPLLFLPILNFSTFLIAFPNIFITYISNAISHSSFILYYLSPSIPVFFYAAIISIDKIGNFKFINKSAVVCSILIASISSTFFFGAMPISLPFWLKNYEVGKFYTTDFHYSAYQIDQNDLAAKKLSKMIPDNSVVSAEQHLLPLLYKKNKITVFPYLNKDTEFIFIDKFSKTKTGWDDTYLEFRNNPNKFYNIYFNDISWKVLEEINGVVLMKKNKKN